ncbi:MAG: PrgI family protein [Lachnospiraceae bacterium]|nr:PrgI family protein [Lachnospiraceae bacterium]
MIIEINKDIEKYQESVAMGLTAKQLVYSILALGSGCLIVFLLYEKIGLTFSCYVAVPVVAPIALCGFYSYNGMGFREVFTRYMRSIFRNKPLVFKSSGYREMVSEIRAREESEKKAAAKKAKEERKRMRTEKIKSRIRCFFKKKA